MIGFKISQSFIDFANIRFTCSYCRKLYDAHRFKLKKLK
jgi:hypothetical protein